MTEWIIGKRIDVILEDNQKVSGKVYSITEDYWGRKLERTMNLDMGKTTAHFPVSKIKKFRISKPKKRQKTHHKKIKRRK